MKVKIIKGTNQIGGCIVEVSTKTTKILLDYGKDLDGDIPFELEGLTYGVPNYDALLISHSHIDHIGLIEKVLSNIPIYVEEKSKQIYDYLCDFTKQEHNRETINMYFNKPILINDIKITPYIVDHSSYNSCMFLIEADNKKILYTGDYRSNGYKGKIFNKTLYNIGKVDLVISEGTSFGRNSNNKSETILSDEAYDIFNKYKNILILQSSTNIDRITSFYKASTKTNKIFIEDLFTSVLTSNINDKLPNPVTFSNCYTFISKVYKYKKQYKEYIDEFSKYSSSKVFRNNYTMLVKTSMIDDIDNLYKKCLLKDTCLIYSLWNGYKESDNMKEFLNQIKDYNIDIINLHTSGHADIKTISKLMNIINPDKIIFIHTNEKNMTYDFSNKVLEINDNEEIEV